MHNKLSEREASAKRDLMGSFPALLVHSGVQGLLLCGPFHWGTPVNSILLRRWHNVECHMRSLRGCDIRVVVKEIRFIFEEGDNFFVA